MILYKYIGKSDHTKNTNNVRNNFKQHNPEQKKCGNKDSGIITDKSIIKYDNNRG